MRVLISNDILISTFSINLDCIPEATAPDSANVECSGPHPSISRNDMEGFWYSGEPGQGKLSNLVSLVVDTEYANVTTTVQEDIVFVDRNFSPVSQYMDTRFLETGKTACRPRSSRISCNFVAAITF